MAPRRARVRTSTAAKDGAGTSSSSDNEGSIEGSGRRPSRFPMTSAQYPCTAAASISLLKAGLDQLFATEQNDSVAEAEALAAAAPASPTRQATALPFYPTVDWSRYNLQLLFVDRSGTVRSRFAAGIFERIAEWNGWSRSIIPAACGLHAQGAEETSVSKMAALFSAGSSLGLRTRMLAQPPERLDFDYDLDFFDLVLCLDRDLYEEILAELPQEHFEFYRKKVVLLSLFSEYESEGIMLARGGLALLPSQLSWILRGGYSESKRVVDVPSPDFASESGADQTASMIKTLILACGGLFKFLVDSRPDLKDYDPIE